MLDRRHHDLSPHALNERIVTLEEGHIAMVEWRKTIDANTEATKESTELLKAILEASRTIKRLTGFFKWLGGFLVLFGAWKLKVIGWFA